ncbi:MAG: hypothetical protein J6Y02_17235 [Pseudobutyrivibrio sp.]|nr:hypothetical protein [Pseudobutyrivibrio sp.]
MKIAYLCNGLRCPDCGANPDCKYTLDPDYALNGPIDIHALDLGRFEIQIIDPDTEDREIILVENKEKGDAVEQAMHKVAEEIDRYLLYGDKK